MSDSLTVSKHNTCQANKFKYNFFSLRNVFESICHIHINNIPCIHMYRSYTSLCAHLYTHLSHTHKHTITLIYVPDTFPIHICIESTFTIHTYTQAHVLYRPMCRYIPCAHMYRYHLHYTSVYTLIHTHNSTSYYINVCACTLPIHIDV